MVGHYRLARSSGAQLEQPLVTSRNPTLLFFPVLLPTTRQLAHEHERHQPSVSEYTADYSCASSEVL